MRTFAYLRVSTLQQLDRSGLDRQREIVQTFIQSKDWTCVRVFTEQQSGGVEFQDRLVLIEMLELAAAFNAEAIVVERADRLARDLVAQEVFLAKCAEHKVLVYSADSGEELTLPGADPTRIMLRQIVGVLAQWEKAMLVKKLQDGRRRTKQKTGMPCGGKPGYGREGDTDQQSYETSVMKWIVERRQNFKTYLELAKQLNDRKVQAPGGGKYWHASTVYRMWRRAIEDLDIPPKPHTSLVKM
jgi:DNA invertase Pin-like site-specific DNA recombinase